MKAFKSKQIIGQLDKRKGGYFFLKLEAAVVHQFENKRHSRLICTLDKKLSFQCGLNNFGDGNYFIILSAKNLATIGKTLGDHLNFEIVEDPNPLGVDMPAVLEALMEQEPDLKKRFYTLTLGKQRGIIHQVIKIKDIDKQIHKATDLIKNAHKPRPKKEL